MSESMTEAQHREGNLETNSVNTTGPGRVIGRTSFLKRCSDCRERASFSYKPLKAVGDNEINCMLLQSVKVSKVNTLFGITYL